MPTDLKTVFADRHGTLPQTNRTAGASSIRCESMEEKGIE